MKKLKLLSNFKLIFFTTILYLSSTIIIYANEPVDIWNLEKEEKIVDDNEIDLNTSKPEFSEWKWANLDDLPGMIVEFKKKLYEKLVPKIKLIIG